MDFFTPSQSTLFLLEIILWTTGITAGIGKVLFWTGIIRIHHYRMSRFIDFLGTKQGIALLAHPVGISDAILALCLVLLLQFYDTTHLLWNQFLFASILLYLSHIAWYVHAVKPQHRFRFQSFVIGATAIVLSLLGATLLYTYFPLPSVIDVAVFQVAIPIFGVATTALISWITGVSERLVSAKARARIESMQPIIIAMSGTHGRSTTRTALEHILASSYNVLSIPAHADESLAETIFNQLSEEHQIVLYEIDPTSPEDVVMSLAVAPPIVLVIPAIEESYIHVPFIDQTQFSKSYVQMIEALPNNGLVVLNADDAKTAILAEHSAARVKYFSLQSVAHAYLRSVSLQSEFIDCEISVGSQKRTLHIPAIGTEPIAALLASSIVAEHLGIAIEAVAHAVEGSSAPHGTTTVSYGVNHAFIMNATALSSYSEIRSAFDYASIHTTKEKVLLIDTRQQALWRLTLPFCVDIINQYMFIGSEGKTVRDICIKEYNIQPERMHLLSNSRKAADALRTSMTPQHLVIALGPLPSRVQEVLQTP